MTTLVVESRKSPSSVLLIALALIGALILGGAGGYLVKSLQVTLPIAATGTVAVDRTTGYPAGSADDERMLAFLVRSGYVGGGTVVMPLVDRVTGYPSGSADDQRMLAFLVRSGYEGGGTVVQMKGSTR